MRLADKGRRAAGIFHAGSGAAHVECSQRMTLPTMRVGGGKHDRTSGKHDRSQ